MKTLRASLLVTTLLTLFAFTAAAQQGLEDVVYLNNGNIYRGIIIEQIPNVSLKVQTIGGNVFSVPIGDVMKITKEPSANASRQKEYGSMGSYTKDSMRRQYNFRKKGYFFQGQILLENLQGGVRIVNGYKFGRFGYLGIGVGIDGVISSPSIGNTFGGDFDDRYSGAYLPLYLYYGGDILKKRITPFYAIEAGYAMATGAGGGVMSIGMGERSLKGGMMGGVGFGVKFNTRRRVNFNLIANVNFKHVRYNETYTYYDQNGNPNYMYDQQSSALLVFPGIRFGLGF